MQQDRVRLQGRQLRPHGGEVRRQDQLQGRVQQQDQVQRDQRDRVQDLLQQPDLQDQGLQHQQRGKLRMEESKREQGRLLKPAPTMLASLKVE